MSEYIDVRWEVDDGYVGKTRSQRTRIYLEDLAPLDTEAEVMDHVEEAIREDLMNRIIYSFVDDSIDDKIINAWRALKDSQE